MSVNLLQSSRTCKLSPIPFSCRGFTLIELLVVLFIISIVTSVALLSISRNENKKIEAFANDLTQLITLAEEQAMLQPAILGIAFQSDSFEFASYRTINEKKKGWVRLNDNILRKHAIPSDMRVEVKANKATPKEKEESEEKFTPQIIISTNGDVSPFYIFIGKRGDKARFGIEGEADGTITNKPLS